MITQEIEELKAIMSIIPTDDFWDIKVGDAVEKFRSEHPKIFRQIFEKKFRKSIEFSVKSLFDQWRKKAGYG